MHCSVLQRAHPLLLCLQDCLEFVRSELPEYLDAYRRLGKPVERANFFRCVWRTTLPRPALQAASWPSPAGPHLARV